MNRSRPDSPSRLDPALSRWLDGRATPEEARAVEARLASDPRLAAEVARLAAAMDSLREDAAKQGPHPDLAVRVLAAVANGDPDAHEARRFARAARWWSVAAAVLFAVGVGGTLAVRRAGGGQGPQALDSSDLLAHVESWRMAEERARDLVTQPETDGPR